MRNEQFLRISRLLGDSAIKTLHDKTVTVVGLGAVGGMALESLVRSGVGKVRIVDFDTIGITNLNRQILATYDTIGSEKTQVAKERIGAINPSCEVEVLPLFVNKESVHRIFEGKETDLVIDAIDSLSPKVALLEYAYKANIPAISSMGAALRRDPFLVRKADLMDTWGCPLAKQVRYRLKRRGVGRGIDVIFSAEEIRFIYKDPSEEEHADFNERISSTGRRRNVLGSLPTVTAIFGQHLAHLALTKLLGEAELSGVEVFNAR
ncbi:MAG: tRNA threonylcarbamoyladenosine dehydratase [Spirochaetes bacterium ADurb.Bin315]|jgi:tRNA A37 threonylcarbamoyladenosine dehydratase|nr:tRNA threonylcarbamoyladenosine dehydratase [Spirochaetota bacterium]OQA42354.1 MAG: tRNA threonylcarbamoyladenosine dehydratase [Spirochaetes bacterium ADurb.Bin315]TAH58121.1 MAG: tRNA threonylcarbamoyladenosine dehydratase [Sphaerochaeta sp.]HOE89843.1 tRNA threonylcarbamoyladenosine dehydratase [Sphaerochaeta sp.]HOR80562.1 tRNA threonylcarbamoyladenosine dehydratase [Sphaerochaeta sp.]